jgi:glutamate N-acetyltransferase / amino-acid N-acetyltransferase
MSVTAASGFLAYGLAAGLKSSGRKDLALVVNTGPDNAAAGVFTTNRVKAAPVVWSEQVLADGQLRAVVLNSGGANACTGPEGFADTHRLRAQRARLRAQRARLRVQQDRLRMPKLARSMLRCAQPA